VNTAAPRPQRSSRSLTTDSRITRIRTSTDFVLGTLIQRSGWLLFPLSAFSFPDFHWFPLCLDLFLVPGVQCSSNHQTACFSLPATLHLPGVGSQQRVKMAVGAVSRAQPHDLGGARGARFVVVVRILSNDGKSWFLGILPDHGRAGPQPQLWTEAEPGYVPARRRPGMAAGSRRKQQFHPTATDTHRSPIRRVGQGRHDIFFCEIAELLSICSWSSRRRVIKEHRRPSHAVPGCTVCRTVSRSP